MQLASPCLNILPSNDVILLRHQTKNWKMTVYSNNGTNGNRWKQRVKGQGQFQTIAVHNPPTKTATFCVEKIQSNNPKVG